MYWLVVLVTFAYIGQAMFIYFYVNYSKFFENEMLEARKESPEWSIQTVLFLFSLSWPIWLIFRVIFWIYLQAKGSDK